MKTRLPLLAIMVGLAACSAEFESGVTKCGENRSCPDGFSCNASGVCVSGAGTLGAGGAVGLGVGGGAAPSNLGGGGSGAGGSGTVDPGAGGSGAKGGSSGTVDPGAGGSGAKGGSSGTVDPGAGGGGGTVNPGAGGGGGTANPGGAGGAGPPAAGTAPMKFCSSLLRNGLPINFELVVGTVRMKAWAVNCSTPLNQPCMRVPVGEQTATLYEGTKVLATKTLNIFAGGEYYAYTDEKDDKVSYGFVNFNVGPEATCSNKAFPP